MKTVHQLWIAFLMICSSTQAQQDVQFTNFQSNLSSFNPASIIMTKDICGDLLARNQWNGFTGNPNTAFLDVRAANLIPGYVGLQFTADALGMQHSNQLKVSYAHAIVLKPGAKIGLGLSANFFQMRWGGTYITPDSPVSVDVAIPDNPYSKSNFDLDGGIFFTGNNIRMGLSSTHLNQADFSSAGIIDYQAKRHYYVFAGYDLNRPWGLINPNVLAKSDGASTQLDLQVLNWISYRYLIGINYRIQDAISPLVGIKKSTKSIQMSVVYSYDITTSKIANYSHGSHEISLSICYLKPTYRERYTNPRNLGNYDFGPRSRL